MSPKTILLCVCVFLFFKYLTVSFHTCTRDTAEKSPNKEFSLNGSVLFYGEELRKNDFMYFS